MLTFNFFTFHLIISMNLKFALNSPWKIMDLVLTGLESKFRSQKIIFGSLLNVTKEDAVFKY